MHLKLKNYYLKPDQLLRTKGSHKIYFKAGRRMVIPFHSGKTLHPKIIKQLFSLPDVEQK